jgi:Trk K+ transport system NAD-binding subunit
VNKGEWRLRLRYWFDNTMSRGTAALIGWLAVVSLALVITLSALISIFDNKPTTLGHALSEIWSSVVTTFKLGPATTGSVPTRLLVIGLAIAGLFFASTLISLLTSGVNKKIAELRKGRSPVMEKDHTVILGWSDQIFTIIPLLVEANESSRRAAVAILAEKDKVEMEDAIRARIGKTGTTRVVCRTGSPLDASLLHRANVKDARSVLVLSPPATDDPDNEVVKTLLAVNAGSGPREEAHHIVACVQDSQNLNVAQLAGGPAAHVVDADDITARITVQTARQSGLSAVYMHLLEYEGSEFYVVPEPGLTGRTFGDAQFAYNESCLVGLCGPDGAARLNPPMDTVITAEDKLVLLAEDDSTIRLDEYEGPVEEAALVAAEPLPEGPERCLVLGWNRRAPSVLRELDSYVAPGSVIDVVTERPDAAPIMHNLVAELKRAELSLKQAGTWDRQVLDGLGVGCYNHIIVLCDDEVDAAKADSRALATLLHLRDIGSRLDEQYAVVAEMRDDRDRELAQITQADDFIVSEKLISMLMTQISESRDLVGVFADLFDSDGSEIYLKPAADYVRLGVEVTFATLVEAARRRGEVVIGYRRPGDRPGEAETIINPAKAVPVTLGPRDRLIVIAED